LLFLYREGRSMGIREKGFTLVELVVVIVILGILAATAIPRYADYTKQTRIAALNGVAGAINSAVNVVQGSYIAKADYTATGTPVTMIDGTTVAVATGSPSAGGGIPTTAAAGIGNAINVQGFTYAVGTTSFEFPTAITNCNVTYAITSPYATINSAGC
jgi:MSHA pilin protein MshA